MVAIEVLDANDNPPLFSESNYTAIVQVRKQDLMSDIVVGLYVTSTVPAQTLPQVYKITSLICGFLFLNVTYHTLQVATSQTAMALLSSHFICFMDK